MKRIIFYHGDADGKCAAAIAGRSPGPPTEDGPGNVQYHPVNYGSAKLWEHLEGADPNTDEVWIVDFTFDMKEMRDLYQLFGAGLRWFDHHKTVMDKLALEENASLNMIPGARLDGTAACMLVWQYCYPGKEAPMPVKYIADRDIWKFEFGDATRHFYETYLTESPHHAPDQELWDYYFDIDPLDLSDYIRVGGLLRKARMGGLRSVIKRFGRDITESVKEHFGKTVLVNYPGSGDLGAAARELGYDTCWAYIEDGSEGDRTIITHSIYTNTDNAADYVKQYGGGGHPGAAGYTVELLLKTIRLKKLGDDENVVQSEVFDKAFIDGLQITQPVNVNKASLAPGGCA